MNRHLLSSASLMLLVMANGAAAAGLAPHRAFYDLDVKRLEQGGGINSIKGKLAYEITGSSCAGYAVNYRIANRISYSEGGVQVLDTHMTSWESGDGLEMDYAQKQFIDARLNSESRIKVKKAGPGAPGEAEVVLPEPKQFQTDAAAIFPTAFQVKLIEVAQKGDSRDESLIYEGSEDQKPLKVISFIGPKRSAKIVDAGVKDDELKKLNDLPSWPMSISYYNIDNSDDAPVYQATFIMLENGVSTDLVLDYGAYALSGKLSKIEMLPEESCD